MSDLNPYFMSSDDQQEAQPSHDSPGQWTAKPWNGYFESLAATTDQDSDMHVVRSGEWRRWTGSTRQVAFTRAARK